MEGKRKAWIAALAAGALYLAQWAVNIIGLAGIPEDLATWGMWTPMISKHLMSYGLAYLGTTIMLWAAVQLWKDRARARHSGAVAADPGVAARSKITVIWPPPKGTRTFPNGGFVWIDDHPFDLIDRVKGQTQVGISATSQRYKYKWSPLEAIIRDVRQADGPSKNIYVTLDTDDAHGVKLKFAWQYDEHLLHLIAGKKLRFVGMIESFNDREINYVECEPLARHE